MPTPPSRQCRMWKRNYMESEHARRKYVDQWDRDIHELSSEIDHRETTIVALKAELKHARKMQNNHRKLIQQLQNTLTLHGIPVKRNMMSISNCRASDDEICPLSLEPINKSPLPLSNDDAPCTIVLNPAKPDHKCAELECGHRFNSLWLVYHFIERSTFRCPVCRSGQTDFHFQHKDLPPSVIQMMASVNAAKKMRAPQ